jgi:hypothetical protein
LLLNVNMNLLPNQLFCRSCLHLPAALHTPVRAECHGTYKAGHAMLQAIRDSRGVCASMRSI